MNLAAAKTIHQETWLLLGRTQEQSLEDQSQIVTPAIAMVEAEPKEEPDTTITDFKSCLKKILKNLSGFPVDNSLKSSDSEIESEKIFMPLLLMVFKSLLHAQLVNNMTTRPDNVLWSSPTLVPWTSALFDRIQLNF